jgi:hypothetical protein
MTREFCGHVDESGRRCLFTKNHGPYHCYDVAEMAAAESDNRKARERGVCGYGHLLFPLDVRGIVLDGKAKLTAVAVHITSAAAGVLTIPLNVDKLPAEDRGRLQQNLLTMASMEDEERENERHNDELDGIDEMLWDAMLAEREVGHG